MLFTIFCCFSTALSCTASSSEFIATRPSSQFAWRCAEVEKEYENQNVAVAAKLSAKLTAKESELAQARSWSSCTRRCR